MNETVSGERICGSDGNLKDSGGCSALRHTDCHCQPGVNKLDFSATEGGRELEVKEPKACKRVLVAEHQASVKTLALPGGVRPMRGGPQPNGRLSAPTDTDPGCWSAYGVLLCPIDSVAGGGVRY